MTTNESRKSGPTTNVKIVAKYVAAGATVIGVQYIVNSGKARAAPAFNSLPPPPAHFVNRTREQKRLLAAERGVVITGMPGVGKTALAALSANSLARKYPGPKIFIDMNGPKNTPMKVRQVMEYVIHVFRPRDDLRGMSEDELAAQYRSVLNGQRVLLVLDDCGDLSQVEALLPPTSCKLLITSSLAFDIQGNLDLVRLEVLSEDEARRLLLKLYPKIKNHADEIAQLCGYLPLALRVAGSAMKGRPDLKPEQYALQLAQQKVGTATPVDDLEARVAATVRLAYEGLEADSQRHWRMLCVFPAPFDKSAAAAVWDLAAEDAYTMLGDLAKFSLVKFDEVNEQYSLHNLLREFACRQLTRKEGQAAQLRHAGHYLEVARNAANQYNAGGKDALAGLKLLDANLSHIRAGQAWASANKARSDEALQLAMEYPASTIDILPLRLRPAEYAAWLDAGLKAARRVRDKEKESRLLVGRADTLIVQGKARQAMKLAERALAIDRKLKNRRHSSTSLGTLGDAYNSLGEAGKAIDLYKEALSIARKIGDRQGEGAWLGLLGDVYRKVSKPGQAARSYEAGLTIARELEDSENESTWLGGLGDSYSDLGQLQRAARCYEKALKLARALGDRQGEGALLGQLGDAYLDLSQARKAVTYHKQALAIARELDDRENVGIWLGGLGNDYLELEKWQQAIEHYEQALDIAREIQDREGEGTWLSAIGDVFLRSERPQEAISKYKSSLEILRKGEDRELEADTLKEAAVAYEKLGQVGQAIQFTEKALKIFEDLELPKAAATQRQLARLTKKTVAVAKQSKPNAPGRKALRKDKIQKK